MKIVLNPDKLKRLANSQLEHILIALRDGDRAFNVRDVLDPWWCFERGLPFVSKRRDGGYAAIQFNKPCAWERRDALLHFDWLSEGATRIIDLGKRARVIDRNSHPDDLRLIVDHSIPIARISEQLWLKEWTRDSLRAFLTKNFKRAVISYTENHSLTEAGLVSKMPAGWSFGGDPFARYEKAGIRAASMREVG